MALIVPTSAVSDLIEVSLSTKDFNTKNHDESNIFENIRKCNGEEVVTHNQKGEENNKENVEEDERNVERNVDENLRDVTCDITLLNRENQCYDPKKLKNNETSSISVNKFHPSDKADLNGSNEKNKLRIDYEKCDIMDNGNDTAKKVSKNILNFIDSDSEEETSLYKTLSKKSCIADDESLEHSESTEQLQITEHKNNLKNRSQRRIVDSESEEDIQTNVNSNFSQTDNNPVSTAIGSYRDLIDSESEDEKQKEETENNFFNTSEEISETKDAKKKSVKKRKGSIRASKDEAMRQIHSETQRLLRETEISLPYHRPKQRTLQEFLNRKKISTALPEAPSTAVKLKMSSVIISKVVAEKEKEAELFYKSSDSEDDTQQSILDVSKNTKNSFTTNKTEEVSSTDINHICSQDPKNIETNVQNSHNEKEIELKDCLNLDASRCMVLPEKGFCDHQNVKLVPLTNNNCNLNDGSDILLLQTANKHKKNFQKHSLPRKLFDTDIESETNDVSKINHDKQRMTKEIIETVISSLNEKKSVDVNRKESETMTNTKVDNHQLEILNVAQNDSKKTDGCRNKTSSTEVTEILEIPNIINKEIAEIPQRYNDESNSIVTNSDDYIIVDDENNKNDKRYFETNDMSSSTLISDAQSNIQGNSSTNESEKYDSHVQGLPLPIFEDEISSNRKKLPTLISNSKVTLKGSPGMIIDLTDDAKPNVNGVNSLLDRFFDKHLNTKKQINNKSEVTVVHLQNTQNGPLPIKEVLSYTASINTDNSELNKPGAKLLRLKENLKLQMTLKRNKEWKQKELELEAQEKEEWHEEIENDCDLSEQEESELSIELNDSEESEPEENDVCIKDKKRSKCLFADDEAEVTDNEDSSIGIEEETYMNDSITESDHEEDENEKKEGEKDEESLEANMNNGNKSNSKDNNANVHKSFDTAKNNKTNQLIEDSQDDSNITNLSYLQNDNNQLNIETDTPKINCDDNDWSESESNMPAYQQHEIATRSQICKTPLTKTSMLDMVSPITQLSVLNATLDSNKKDSSEKRKCLIDKDESVFLENTQNDEFSEPIYRNKNVLKKKLFDDIEEAIDDEYLMQLCSGKFESTQRTDLDLFSQSNTTILQLHSSKSELCSGNFNAKLVTQSENPKINKTPQDMKSVSDEDSNNSINYMRETNKVKEVESELKLRIASSDDENEEDTFLKPKKRPTKRLTLSDSEEENESLSDEENNDIDNEEVEEQYIDYDSEENEVVTIPAKDIKKVAADFLEEEAELSGSDWDSADEDEKDLDKLEFEEADDEHIDEHKVKGQLEKIHMKQILDEDKREVRLLKELLFEDGDLHTDGAGRERKFKWRNIDKLGNNIELPQVNENDGWVDMQDDEEEVKWSKLRHERDKFLEERMKSSNNEIEDELCDSQIFKLGLQAVKKIKDNKSQKQDTSLNQIDSSENMEPIMPRNITDLLNGPKNIGKKSQTIYNVIKKRSLLSRGEESLARMASLAKQGDSISHTINTRNFVFQYIDQSLDDSSKKEDKLIEKEVDLQKKPRKRKTTSDMLSKSNKRRK